jgi:hypothetical protein
MSGAAGFLIRLLSQTDLKTEALLAPALGNEE